jgi:putative heme-binding domain-containing protein
MMISALSLNDRFAVAAASLDFDGLPTDDRTVAEESRFLLAEALLSAGLRGRESPRDLTFVTKPLEAGLKSSRVERFQQLIDRLIDRRPESPTWRTIADDRAPGNDSATTPMLKAHLRKRFERAVKDLGASHRSAEVRTTALKLLATRSDELANVDVGSLLGPSQPIELQRSALIAARIHPSKKTAEAIISRWRELSPSLQAAAAETMTSSPELFGPLIESIERGSISSLGFNRDALRRIAAKNPSWRKIVERLAEKSTDVDRAKVVERYRSILGERGDRSAGKAVFERHCSKCHRLGGIGETIGADLTALRDRGREAALVNILDPSRDVKPSFQITSVETTDGSIATGMIAAENDQSITLRRSDGSTTTIRRGDAATITVSERSFMPEELEKSIDMKQMTDLLEFLMRPD